MANPNDNPPDALEVPIVDRLDLHHFRPRDVASVVREYLIEARALGLPEVLLIHGKGRGVLRRTVHSVLRAHPDVRSFHLAGEGGGQWGATVAVLRGVEVPLSPSVGSTE